jgi:hypothetical protein
LRGKGFLSLSAPARDLWLGAESTWRPHEMGPRAG